MRENPILRNDGDDNPMGMLTNLFDIHVTHFDTVQLGL